jgi:E3 ubiquitin-protein ligase Mdm2
VFSGDVMATAGSLCVVCDDAPATQLLLHSQTGHLCLCEDCCALCDPGTRGCPVCRQPVDSVVRVFGMG